MISDDIYLILLEKERNIGPDALMSSRHLHNRKSHLVELNVKLSMTLNAIVLIDAAYRGHVPRSLA